MKTYEINLGNQIVKVVALKHRGQLWYHYQGETRSLELKTKTKSGGRSQASVEPGVLRAPMPGKITKVKVKVGEPVKAGETLLVMEAMKMEYSLEADVDGEVVEVNNQENQQVKLGDVLVRVKSND